MVEDNGQKKQVPIIIVKKDSKDVEEEKRVEEDVVAQGAAGEDEFGKEDASQDPGEIGSVDQERLSQVPIIIVNKDLQEVAEEEDGEEDKTEGAVDEDLISEDELSFDDEDSEESPSEDGRLEEDEYSKAGMKEFFKEPAIKVFIIASVISLLLLFQFQIKPALDENDFSSIIEGLHKPYASIEAYHISPATFDLVDDGEGTDQFVLKLGWKNATYETLTADEALDIQVFQDGRVLKRIERPAGANLPRDANFWKYTESIVPRDYQTIYLAYPAKKGNKVEVVVSARSDEGIFGDDASAVWAYCEFDEQGQTGATDFKVTTRSEYMSETGVKLQKNVSRT